MGQILHGSATTTEAVRRATRGIALRLRDETCKGLKEKNKRRIPCSSFG
ncbi:hypothetical protein CES85_4967 [Ochrobactrum quorumnocens]|uniref:Uncharacterized protein n=1 Tax=Ochrobactrum quorumnocens TaxID=271865 RepID=A0A248UBR9_9HYPH|nr:hypothetical protein [[Ochrobactrum] quorumnocens]ASV84175.1 hypothetical protein CES85_4967 [[Ochrobactrum] quorumnocens]